MRKKDGGFSFCRLGGVVVEILQGEDHARTAQMTEHVCETGRVISDHIILKPKTVTVRCEETNVPVEGEDPRDSVRRVWRELEKMWERREPIKLDTTHQTYENMVVTNLSGLHNAPFKFKMNFTVTFTQINKANTQFSSIPVAEMANKAQAAEMKTGTYGLSSAPSIPPAWVPAGPVL